MATVSGMITSYDVNGRPRDLSPIIYDITPTDTPALTMFKKATATQTLHEWTVDALPTSSDNKVVDGADTTSFAGTKLDEKSNRTQISERAVKVADTSKAIKMVGTSDQYEYQLARVMKALKKDVEVGLLTNKIEVGGNSSTARESRGLPCWFTTNVDLGSTGTAATGVAACGNGTDRNVTEDIIKAVIQKAYIAGGDVSVMMAAPAIRSKLTSVLTAGATRFDDIKDKRVSATVDIYESDFGNLKIVSNRVQAGVTYSKDCVFLLDPEYWAVAMLQPFQEEKLARTGGADKGRVWCEWTLEARNEASSGMAADLQ